MPKINYNDLVFFDLKTTRLENGSIIEIGAVDASSGDELSIRVEFDPEKADEGALMASDYSERRWRDAVSLPDALGQFSEFLRNHATLARTSKAGNEYMVAAVAGFNVRNFDIGVLMRETKSLNLFLPMDMRCYDVFPLAMWRMPNLDSYSLDSLLEHCGMPAAGKDALSRARAAMELARNIVSRPFKFRPLEWAR